MTSHTRPTQHRARRIAVALFLPILFITIVPVAAAEGSLTGTVTTADGKPVHEARVTLVELRGHGKSGGRRGHVKRWHDYVEDFQAAAGTVGRPFVVVAHSMGGLVALSALQEPVHPQVRGLAISNALLGVAVEAPKIKLAAAGFLSKVLPWIPLSNELDSSMISRDPEVVRAYLEDPLVLDTMTMRFAAELMSAVERAGAKAPDDLKKIGGVGPKLEGTLNELGIYHFWQIAEFTPDNVAWVDGYLSFKGRIDRDDWIGQAKAFAAEADADKTDDA